MLVTGARGQLAGAIVDVFAQTADVVAYPRADLDIADFDAVMSRVSTDRPDIIVNCAAYNAVDRAEDEPEQAMTGNAFAVRVLARAAAEHNATLVHYSTDFVFDGKASQPYTEEDPPNPQSVYAQSKLLGEWFALEAPRAFVLRVESLFGGSNAKSSIDRIVDALRTGSEAKVFADRTVTPSYIVDVASATRALLERGEPGSVSLRELRSCDLVRRGKGDCQADRRAVGEAAHSCVCRRCAASRIASEVRRACE